MVRKRECSVVGCDREIAHRDLCKGHYNRWQRTRDVQAHKPLRRMTRRHGETCTNDGCDRKYYARGLCRRCYKKEWAREAIKCPEYRERHNRRTSESYHRHREKNLEKRRQRYRDDEKFRESQKAKSALQRLKRKRARFAEILGAK